MYSPRKWSTYQLKLLLGILLWVFFVFLLIQLVPGYLWLFTGSIFVESYDTTMDTMGTLIVINLLKYALLVTTSVVLIKLSNKIQDEFLANEPAIEKGESLRGRKLVKELMFTGITHSTPFGVFAILVFIPAISLFIELLVNFGIFTHSITLIWLSLTNKNVHPLFFREGFMILQLSIFVINLVVSHLILSPLVLDTK